MGETLDPSGDRGVVEEGGVVGDAAFDPAVGLDELEGEVELRRASLELEGRDVEPLRQRGRRGRVLEREDDLKHGRRAEIARGGDGGCDALERDVLVRIRL